MYALLGVHVNTLDRSLKLVPPRIPVQIPVFGRLYSGQVTFSMTGDGVELRLESLAEQPSIIRTMTVRLPEETAKGTCSVEKGEVREVRSGKAGETVLKDVVVAPKGELILRWA
jgi:hypothetical protein